MLAVIARLVGTSGFVLMLVSSEALALTHGRFLPAPLNFPQFPFIANEAYGGVLTQFDQLVVDARRVVGEIRFDYDTWTGTEPVVGSPNEFESVGGAAMAGGFYLRSDLADEGIILAPGFELHWVQTLTATISGPKNEWGARNEVTFPDTLSHGATPQYDGESLPVQVADPPTLAFQDFPIRFPSDGNQYWDAELGLVGINFRTKEVRIIGTFAWGFDVTQMPEGITPGPPAAWGAPSGSYIFSLDNYFDGGRYTDPSGVQFDSVDFTFNTKDVFLLVPEPSAALLLAAGLFGFTLHRPVSPAAARG
jgi:hypothetical protein